MGNVAKARGYIITVTRRLKPDGNFRRPAVNLTIIPKRPAISKRPTVTDGTFELPTITEFFTIICQFCEYFYHK